MVTKRWAGTTWRFSEKVMKRLLREAAEYYNRVGISPTEDDLIDDMAEAIIEETGMSYSQASALVEKYLLR